MFEITKQTVNASEGQFEEHPESYHPRVFVAVTKVVGEVGDGLPEYSPEVYELLTDGQASRVTTLHIASPLPWSD